MPAAVSMAKGGGVSPTSVPWGALGGATSSVAGGAGGSVGGASVVSLAAGIGVVAEVTGRVGVGFRVVEVSATGGFPGFGEGAIWVTGAAAGSTLGALGGADVGSTAVVAVDGGAPVAVTALDGGAAGVVASSGAQATRNRRVAATNVAANDRLVRRIMILHLAPTTPRASLISSVVGHPGGVGRVVTRSPGPTGR